MIPSSPLQPPAASEVTNVTVGECSIWTSAGGSVIREKEENREEHRRLFWIRDRLGNASMELRWSEIQSSKLNQKFQSYCISYRRIYLLHLDRML